MSSGDQDLTAWLVQAGDLETSGNLLAALHLYEQVLASPHVGPTVSEEVTLLVNQLRYELAQGRGMLRAGPVVPVGSRRRLKPFSRLRLPVLLGLIALLVGLVGVSTVRERRSDA